MSHPGLRSHSYGPRRQLLSLSPILQIKEQAQVHMIQQNHCSILLLHRQGKAQASPAPRHLRPAEPFACDPLYSKGFSYDTEAGYDYLSLEQHRWMLRDSPALSLQKRQPWNTEPRLISSPCSPESTPLPPTSTSFSEMQDQETRNLCPWLTAHSKPVCSIFHPAGRSEWPQKASVY